MSLTDRSGERFGDQKVFLLYGHTISIIGKACGMGAKAGTGCNDSDEVQRIGSRNAKDFSSGLIAPDGSQGIQRLGQGELFSNKSGDKPSSPHYSPSLHGSVNLQEVAPGEREALSSQ
jgi:hypothetical protein